MRAGSLVAVLLDPDSGVLGRRVGSVKLLALLVLLVLFSPRAPVSVDVDADDDVVVSV